MAFFRGTNGVDAFAGTTENDYMIGLGGNDSLGGGQGIDRLYGGEGSDALVDSADGGAGDIICGEAGDDLLYTFDTEGDVLDGGFGLDWFYVVGTTNTVIDLVNQNDNAGHAAGDQLRSFERFTGGTGNDRFLASARNEDFWDSQGDDFYNGRGGLDIFRAITPVVPGQLTFELAYGARADELAGLDGITLSSAQSGVGAWKIWNDDGDAVEEAGEVTYQIDELISIEHYVSPGTGAKMAGSSGNEVFYCQNVPLSVNGAGGNDFVAFSGLGSAPGPMIIDLFAGEAKEGGQIAALTGIESVLGSMHADEISGNGIVNTLVGADGGDMLDGRGGNDRLDGGGDIDLLVGGLGNDLLMGGALGDVLDGGDGVDTGCWASSSYGVVIRLGQDATGSGEGDGDTLRSIENAIGSRYEDTIRGDGIGNRIEGLTGSDYLYGGGGNDVLYGDRAPNSLIGEGVTTLDPGAILGDAPALEPEEDYPYTNRLFGQSGNDILIGGGAYDALYGGSGNDRLDGGAGESSNMYGGTGNDTFIVRRSSDDVREMEGEGTDRVFSSTDFKIRDDQSIEILTLTGTRAIAGRGGDAAEVITGNVGNNILAGNDGDDTLSGGLGGDDISGGEGTDSLRGGGGRDWFRFDTGTDGTANVDTIDDFVPADDTIVLDRAIFEAIASDGRISAATFRLGTAAGDANDRILYDQGTGRIFYDADGNGLGATAILFARVDAGTALSAADFVAITASADGGDGGGPIWAVS